MNYNDHDRSHFHARDQDQEVMVEIGTGLVTGTMSRRALKLLIEWAGAHEAELRENWEWARKRKPLTPIEPLPRGGGACSST